MSFDPLTQNITIFAPDGRTPIAIPIPAIDTLNDETVSIALNYGIQIGACLLTLAAVVLMTRPVAKLRRPSSVLHVVGLVLCVLRTAVLAAYFLSPLNHFYQYWSGDYASVPRRFFVTSVFANVLSLLLVAVVAAALVYQAWTMVRLWPGPARRCLVATSAAVALVAVAFRFAFTVLQSRANLDLVPPQGFEWAGQGTLVTYALAIFWFCALFNFKLASHLVKNRGVLPSARSLSSMEALVMTNGILMMVPAIFAGLEWGRFQNFEAGSLTPTSVAIILPLGTLAAQQISSRPDSIPVPSISNGASKGSSDMSGLRRLSHGLAAARPACSTMSSLSASSTSATTSTAPAAAVPGYGGAGPLLYDVEGRPPSCRHAARGACAPGSGGGFDLGLGRGDSAGQFMAQGCGPLYGGAARRDVERA